MTEEDLKNSIREIWERGTPVDKLTHWKHVNDEEWTPIWQPLPGSIGRKYIDHIKTTAYYSQLLEDDKTQL